MDESTHNPIAAIVCIFDVCQFQFGKWSCNLNIGAQSEAAETECIIINLINWAYASNE